MKLEFQAPNEDSHRTNRISRATIVRRVGVRMSMGTQMRMIKPKEQNKKPAMVMTMLATLALAAADQQHPVSINSAILGLMYKVPLTRDCKP